MKKLSEIENPVLLKLADAEITDISSEDMDSGCGCQTCDYGHTLTRAIFIKFSDGGWKSFSFDISEEVSEWAFIKLFCNNVEEFSRMTKEEFITFIKNPENYK